MEEDRLRRNRPKTSSRGSTSTKPSLNQDQTRRDRSTDRRGSTIDSARANRRSGQVTEDRRRIEINHHDRIREPSSSRNQAQAISSARGNRGSSSREESRQRSESSRSRSRVNWKTGRDLSNMPYRSQFNNPSSSPTNNYSPPHAPAPIIAPLPINYNPDEDIEEALFRICNRENLKIPPETIEEYASILRSNYLNQLGNVAELDSASWIMLAQQKFPVRLRQLLINEVQNGQKAIKADDRALVAPTTPALASSEVGIGTMLSGLFDGLFGATQPAEPEIPIPNEVIYPNPFEEKSIDLLYQVALMVHLRGDFYDEHPPKNVMAEIAALHCQVMFGDFDDVVLPIEKTLKNPEHESKFFPEGFSDPVLEQRAFDRYKQLTGIPQEQAQLRVVRIIQSLPKNDGVFRFYVSTGSKDSQHSDDSSEDEWILGISAEKVYKMFETENGEEKISSEWDFTKVTRWKYEEHLQLFTIDLIDLQSGLVFVTSEDDGGVISALLFYYLEIFQSKSHQTETTQKVLPTEVDIEVLVYGQQDSTVFSVKVSDTIVQICNNIAKYLKFESDGRFGLKAKSTSEFLVPNKSLNQQDVDFDDLFVFATRLYIPSPLISKQPDYINFLFAECNHFITNNHWAVAKDQAIKLAALQLQSKHGDYNNKTHTPHFFSNSMLQSILPLDWRQPQIIPEVIREYRRLVGTPPSEANLKYVEAVRKLGTFGDTYFEIQMDSHQDLLSVSVNTICHIDGETRGILSDWSFFDVNLCRVDINAEFLTIEFGTGEVFTCASTKALAIERLIMDYISFEAKRKKAPPQQANADDSKCLVM
uniref:FERM domain-containing protein n=1 Tax=Arcella intermedia TaxID=1963864 RepID=A0A6B2KX36_9EUKA